jgi:predicted RNase H-like HicB family nuclease
MKYTVILEPQDEGGFTVRCLELPGAISQGETREEALANIKEAIGLVLEVLNFDLADRSNAEILKVELADVC